MEYIISLLLLASGLGLLIWGSNALINVASFLAKKYNLSPLATGAIILGFGSSLPELIVSISSAINDTPLVAYGNVVGSNIANIGFVLGISALTSSIPVVFIADEARNQFILIAVSTLVFILFAVDLILNPYEAIFLLGLFCASIVILMRSKSQISIKDHISEMKMLHLIISIIGGLAFVGLGGHLTVYSAVDIAYRIGVSEQLVSLTLVALGTSLPELVASIQLVRIKQPRLIIGNIMGSNIFNLLLVLPMAHLLKPFILNKAELYRDGSFITAITVLFIILCFSWKGKREIRHLGGLTFLMIYCLYIGIISMQMFVL